MFSTLSTEEVMKLADNVGYRLARRYPGVAAEDIAQEAVTELWKSKDYFEKPSEGNIHKALERYGSRYAERERYSYIVGSSQYVYTPREVRALLELYYAAGPREVPTAHDDRLTAYISEDVVVVSLLDLEEALKRTPAQHVRLLVRAYLHGDEPEDRKALTRAVDEVTERLNRHINRTKKGHDGPGARRASNNATAQFNTGNQW